MKASEKSVFSETFNIIDQRSPRREPALWEWLADVDKYVHLISLYSSWRVNKPTLLENKETYEDFVN